MGELDMITVMLEVGANIETLSKSYGTPLGIACAMGQLDAVKLLINRGAKTSWEELDGKIMTATERAKDQNNVFRWLQDTDCYTTGEGQELANGTTTDLSKKKQGKGLDYWEHWECFDTVTNIWNRHPSMIRKRGSFILDYALRKQDSVHKPIQGVTKLHEMIYEGDPALVEQPHSRKETIWGEGIRAINGATYCKAVCRLRAMTPPDRYYMYPLFPHVTRASPDGPWEIL